MRTINNINSLSIIGLGKNAGKTTFLNRILEEVYESQSFTKTVALTSIGRDGEDTDVVTKTSKPKIYIRKGTLVATAADLIRKCDITKEILESTNIPTALGQVVILRALSDGYIEIAGPSNTGDLRRLEAIFKKYSNDLFFLIDGALSRKSTAGHSLTDATILCTGASISENEEKLVNKTVNVVNLLTLDELDKDLKDILNKSKSRVVMLFQENSEIKIKEINTEIALSSSLEIKDSLNENTKLIFVRGVLTDSFIEEIMDNIHFKDLTICAEDGTRFIFSEVISKKLENRNITLKVIDTINLLAVGINPYSTSGFYLDSERIEKMLIKCLKEKLELNVPVIDVRRYEGEVL